MEGWTIAGIQEIERVDDAGRLRRFTRVSIITREGWTLFHEFPAETTSAADIERYFDEKLKELRKLIG